MAQAPPYDPKTLKWNQLHTLNEEKLYCYCGTDRGTGLTFQCERCLNWFHGPCVQIDYGQVVPFICNYRFICSWCGEGGVEFFERHTASWKNIITTAIANMSIIHAPKKYFGKDEIVPYLKDNWNAICTGRQQTKTWWATVGTCLSTSPNDFLPQEGTGHSAASPYTLMETNIFNIRPNPPGHVARGSLPNQDPTTPPVKKPTKRAKDQNDGQSSTKEGKSKKVKSEKSSSKKINSEDTLAYLNKLKNQSPVENITNRDDYRYTLAEPDVGVQGGFRERITDPGVFFSREDRSPFIQLSKDRLSASTDKGFRLARATHFVNNGTWYYEVTIDKPSEVPVPPSQRDSNQPIDGAHTRIGWAQRYATIEAPVGFDEFGYSYRDKTGDKVHLGTPLPYGSTYGPGDVIGFLISIPKIKPFQAKKRERTVIVLKGTLYFEEHCKKPEKLGKVPGSKIYFFKNGVSQGVAFEDIYEGDYYPAVSLYRGAHTTVNFGPDFKHPPMGIEGWRPFCERYVEQSIEETLLDMVVVV